LSGIPLSSDAEEAGEFETLEERIVKTKRDQDNETRVSIRLEAWQVNLSELISMRLGSNKAEIHNRAFVQGVKIIREEIGWSRIDELFTMREIVAVLTTVLIEDLDASADMQSYLHGHTMELNDTPQGELMDSSKVPVQKSVTSELEENFADRMNMKLAQLNRIVIGAGLKTSENAQPQHEHYADEMVSSFKQGVEDAEKLLERYFYRMMSMSAPLGVSVDRETMDDINTFIEYMEGDKKDVCEKLADQIEVDD
jgi:hypothetical protein